MMLDSMHRVRLLDVVAAEWCRLWTLRANYALLGGAVLAVAAGLGIVLAVTGAYDAAGPAERANFETADPAVVAMPFVTFFVAAVAGLTITGDYQTGGMAVSLATVPRRSKLLAAKVIVATAVTLATGLGFACTTILGAWAILGDRPAPINPWTSLADALTQIPAAGAGVWASGMVAMGVGVIVRSTAATLVTVSSLLLVAPIFAHFMPEPWNIRLASLLLPNLMPQLTGADHAYLLSPVGAGAVLMGYAVIALCAAFAVFTRRDLRP